MPGLVPGVFVSRLAPSRFMERRMIRKIVTVLILLPIALLIVMFAVANRSAVTIALDPFGSEPPMFTTAMPLFLALLAALIVGVVIGGAAAWSRQRKWRRRARHLAADLKAARADNAVLRRRLEAVPVAPQAQPQTSIAAIAYRHPSAA
jgi:uncharacterized integral membrane protein